MAGKGKHKQGVRRLPIRVLLPSIKGRVTTPKTSGSDCQPVKSAFFSEDERSPGRLHVSADTAVHNRRTFVRGCSRISWVLTTRNHLRSRSQEAMSGPKFPKKVGRSLEEMPKKKTHNHNTETPILSQAKAWTIYGG